MEPRLLKRLLFITCALFVCFSLITASPKAHAGPVSYDGTSSAEQQKALTSINNLRKQMGLTEVKLDPTLVKAAINHANYANAHYTIGTEGNLSTEVKGKEYYTASTPDGRVAATGYKGGKEILETVYMKERAYDEFDMSEEIRELSLVDNRREVMLTPTVTELGIARVGKATVIVGAVLGEAAEPAAVSVYPYDGMKETWPGYIESVNAQKLVQGEGMTLTIFSNLPDVSDMKASLTTKAGNRDISIPLGVKRLNSGYGYVLTALRQLRGDREYMAEVSFQSGGLTLTKQWTFRTSPFLYELNIDDMPLVKAPQLNVINDRSVVPMRYLFELFGARVEWDQATQTITAFKDELSLKMTIDSPIAYINGQVVQLESPPHLFVYTTYVPLRFISETFGYEVEYNPTTRSVDIWTGILENKTDN
ncbi:stalk domain-containing protein [Paenibacillus sp. S28]|uniref:stalk domain-containing protein n=1 Tax=Paenibacillus sp. S28 TaxID=2767463 RepID=UPI00190AB3BD|nr:stalk domain-containing protein [Paenibacillus sp. S28]MBJ9989392.1 hypothetical protein [Paenibacillus sp. S28]